MSVNDFLFLDLAALVLTSSAAKAMCLSVIHEVKCALAAIPPSQAVQASIVSFDSDLLTQIAAEVHGQL